MPPQLPFHRHVTGAPNRMLNPAECMTPEDWDLERRIQAARDRAVHARTAAYRRVALNQLELLEGRRSPRHLAWLTWTRRTR